MQLKLRRSQKTTGMISKSVSFVLDARAELSAEESAAVKKYGLGNQILYASAKSKAHAETAMSVDPTTGGGFLRGIAAAAMSRLSLNISIDSLTKGHHIECKDLEELLGAEEAIQNACQAIRGYVELAQTFDGREIVIDFEKQVAS
jgi:hypothetical protein